ncbi:tyrosine-type recombinase/integrase [Zhongshania sp.]|uniref:tyrosine-type recombinase/integrase n=1 Tax=Zhongshania sp. TaxID=1971902 RepID=UPI00356721CB
MADLPKYRGVRPHGNRIQINYSVGGEHTFETIDLRPNKTNLDAARKIRQQRIDDAKQGTVAPDSKSFAELAQLYLESLDVALSTAMSYHGILEKYWMPSLARRDIAEIRYSDLLALVNKIDWPSGKTRKNALIPLRGVFELAVADNLRPDNPAVRFKQVKHQKPEIDPFTADEWLAIYEKLADPWKPYFTLLWETGMRHPAEPMALTWDDFKGDRLRVNKAIVRRRLKEVKNYRAREVLLTGAAQSVLRNHPGRFTGGPTFPNTKGRHQLDGDQPNKAWREALKASGVRPRRAYNLRHSWASRALTAGLKPAFVAQQLGHSLKMTLEVYGKYITSDEDKSQIALLEAAVKNEKLARDLPREV